SAPSTWYAQVPNSTERPCSFPKTTENSADTSWQAELHLRQKTRASPLGDGSAVMPLQTVSKTLFQFNFHLS
ncbi:hypothetical protein, partial [Kingella kingae]|uniref:hypothetical protein n=1 Tax=Kingella kingae TaxID=504 RepID=UPI001E605A1A